MDAFAQSTIPLPSGGLDPALTDNIVSSNVPDAAQTGLSSLAILGEGGLLTGLLGNLNIMLGALAILFIAIIATKMVFAREDQSSFQEAQSQLQWVVVGLLLISAAEILAFQVLDPTQDLLEGAETTVRLRDVARRILNLLKYIMGGVILFAILREAYRLVVGGTKDDPMGNMTNLIRSLVFGVAMILVAEGGVLLISFPDIPAVADPEELRAATDAWSRAILVQIGGSIRFITSFLGTIGVAMLIYSALLYTTNFGNEEQTTRARQILIGTLVGLAIVLSSYAITTILIP